MAIEKTRFIRAVYPGSFDPLTSGHFDIIRRAAALFDEVIVCIMVNCQKSYLFPESERRRLIEESLQELPNVIVDAYQGLTVQYAVEHDAQVIIRGIRNAQDLTDEMNLAFYNRRLAPSVETVYLTPIPEYAEISSSRVRELLVFDGDIKGLVPEKIENAIKQAGRMDE